MPVKTVVLAGIILQYICDCKQLCLLNQLQKGADLGDVADKVLKITRVQRRECGSKLSINLVGFGMTQYRAEIYIVSLPQRLSLGQQFSSGLVILLDGGAFALVENIYHFVSAL